MNEDQTEFTFDSPEFVKALTYYQSFFTDGVAPKELPEGTLEPDFVAGKIGAFQSGPWHIGILDETGGEGFMDSVTLAPLPADEKQASFIGGSNLAVFKSSENRDAAWKFVQWLSQPEVQARVVRRRRATCPPCSPRGTRATSPPTPRSPCSASR